MINRVNAEVSFSAGGNGSVHQVSGWSRAEVSHTWSVGCSCSIVIDAPDAPHGYYLEVDWAPHKQPPYFAQPLSISVNGSPGQPYVLSNSEVAAFYFPPPNANDRRLMIRIDHPNPHKPATTVFSKDTRELAICFRRIRILVLVAARPTTRSISSRCTVQAKEVGAIVTDLEASTGKSVAQISNQFEVIAGNCDLGLALREMGADGLSLLKFSGASPLVAINQIDCDFDEVGKFLTANVANNPISEWMVSDRAGLRFHTHHSSNDISQEVIIKKTSQHIAFLKRKILEDLKHGEKVFVFADHKGTNSYESALAVFLALNRSRSNRMLWVYPNLVDSESIAEELFPGMVRCSLPILKQPLLAGHISVSGWASVLSNASQVFELTAQAPALRNESLKVDLPNLIIASSF